MFGVCWFAKNLTITFGHGVAPQNQPPLHAPAHVRCLLERESGHQGGRAPILGRPVFR